MKEDVRELVLVVADQALDIDIELFRNIYIFIYIYLDVEHLHVFLLAEHLEIETKGGGG